MKKCAVVYNPTSGRKKIVLKDNRIKKMIEDAGYQVEMHPTKWAGHATRIVEKLGDDIDLLVCCGGDGTLNESVRGNLLRQKPILMSQLPIGTQNDVGAMYGYTRNHLVNLEMLLNGVNKNIDVPLINDRPFVYVACVGNFVDIAYNTPSELKHKYGRLGYVINAMKELKNKLKLYDITYEIEGKEYNGKYSFIFVSNTSRISGFNNIYTDVKLDDGMFEVALCEFDKKSALIGAFTQIVTKGLNHVKGVTYYRTNNFKIRFNSKIKDNWCLDGEEYKTKNKEFIFTVNKDINMRMPKKNVVKLFTKEDKID